MVLVVLHWQYLWVGILEVRLVGLVELVVLCLVLEM